MPEPSATLLKVFAASIWLYGSAELLWKGTQHLLSAEALTPGLPWPAVLGVSGLVLGGIKARFLFDRACRRNLDRIDALERRRPWDFYRPRFFVLLAAMITLGVTLSRLAQGRYAFLLGVAALDLSIGTALALSARNFLRRASR